MFKVVIAEPVCVHMCPWTALGSVVSSDFIEKLPFQQLPEGGEGDGHVTFREGQSRQSEQ